MANARHVAKLREGVQAWNAWRAENPSTAPDLSDLKLPDGCRKFGPEQGGPIDLSGVNLRRAVLAGTDLSRARLENADLSGANIKGANLAQADFAGARLAGANLSGAWLGGVRNLAQMAIDLAQGCKATVLPDHLVLPPAWLGGEGAAPPAKAAEPAADRAGGVRGDPHSTLGVGRNASAREIRAAYLRLVKELHPDGRAQGAVPDGADERLKLINDAYQELKGFGRQAAARRTERRRRARRASAVFLAGVITALAPVVVVLAGGLYYAGWLGAPDREPVSSVASHRTEDPPRPAAAKVASEHAREPAGRQTAWSEAQRLGTREAWQQFIAAYPDGEPAAQARAAVAAIERAEARRRAEIAAWAEVEKDGTKDSLERFVAAYPDGAHAGRARQAIAVLDRAETERRAEMAAWSEAEKDGSKESLERFVATYPGSVHASQARRALASLAAAQARRDADRAAWTEAERSGAKAALRQYLEDFPDGSYTAAARERVALIEADENDRDDAAWLKAERRHNKASYAGYLASYPSGRRAIEARRRIAELDRGETRPPAEPVRAAAAPPVRPRLPEAAGSQSWPSADEPFIGADGRIRR